MSAKNILLCSIFLWATACQPNDTPLSVSKDSPGEKATVAKLGLIVPEYAPGDPAEVGESFVALEARFLSAPWGYLKKIGGRVEQRSFGPGRQHKLEEGIASGEVIVMYSPAITLFSGQRGNTVVINESAFIEDFRLVQVPDKGTTIDPVISVLRTGCIVDVQATAEKGEISFELIEAQLVIKLGSRGCALELPQFGSWADPVPLEEPVLLRAAALAKDPVRLKDGGSLLLPLDVEVQQYTGQARSFARDLKETYKAEPVTWGEGRREFLLLLSGKVVSEKG